MEKYLVPAWIKITGADTKDKFFLINKRRDKEFFINKTIKNFLALFKEPRTVREIIRQHIDKSSSSDNREISGMIKKFIRDMLSLGVIVEESELKKFESRFDKPLLKCRDKLNGYTIKKLIDINTKTQVYLAREPIKKTDVIIKLFYKPLDLLTERDKKKLRLFRQEFKLMKPFRNHPNICNLYQYHEDRYAYAVLEYIEGRNFHDLYSSRKDSIEVRHQVAAGIIRAVAALHGCNVFHGDIHASNFIAENNGNVKLIDFGFGYINDDKKRQIKSNGGVTDYMPPERVRVHGYKVSKAYPTFRGEVYQVGIILYCLYAKKMPFTGNTWRELGESIMNAKIVVPKCTINNERIPKPVKNFIERAIAKNPDDRFENACTMLQHWLALNAKSEKINTAHALAPGHYIH